MNQLLNSERNPTTSTLQDFYNALQKNTIYSYSDMAIIHDIMNPLLHHEHKPLDLQSFTPSPWNSKVPTTSHSAYYTYNIAMTPAASTILFHASHYLLTLFLILCISQIPLPSTYTSRLTVILDNVMQILHGTRPYIQTTMTGNSKVQTSITVGSSTPGTQATTTKL